MTKGSSTRSGLLWEVERILDECNELPQVLLMENVPQVIGKKNIKDFQLWRSKLESLGYSNYVQLLNSKNYGIPQNRNRCFMVSILGDYHYTFPKKKKLELRLKDMLEDKVDEKYYLSEETIKNFIAKNIRDEEKGNGFRFEPHERERESRNAHGGLLENENNRHISKGLIGGGLSITEQESTNQMKYSQQVMKPLEQSNVAITNRQSRLSKTIRSGGRGSLDRHEWDIVCEEKIL